MTHQPLPHRSAAAGNPPFEPELTPRPGSTRRGRDRRTWWALGCLAATTAMLGIEFAVFSRLIDAELENPDAPFLGVLLLLGPLYFYVKIVGVELAVMGLVLAYAAWRLPRGSAWVVGTTGGIVGVHGLSTAQVILVVWTLAESTPPAAWAAVAGMTAVIPVALAAAVLAARAEAR